MTGTVKQELEKEVTYQAEKAKRDYELHRTKIALMGKRLVELGTALINNPESVNPLPEIDAHIDFREALNTLPTRGQVVELCQEIKSLRCRQEAAAQRKASLGF